MGIRKFALWITDPALIAALKLEAGKRGITQRAAVTEALRFWLAGATPQAAARAAAPTPQKAAGPRRSQQPAGPPVSVPLCKQCGHMAHSHFRNACLLGCYCRKFVKP